jgi:hypothetical protein
MSRHRRTAPSGDDLFFRYFDGLGNRRAVFREPGIVEHSGVCSGLKTGFARDSAPLVAEEWLGKRCLRDEESDEYENRECKRSAKAQPKLLHNGWIWS